MRDLGGHQRIESEELYRPVTGYDLSAAPEAIGNHPLHRLHNPAPPCFRRERAQIFYLDDR
jgi:hypothetical protein